MEVAKIECGSNDDWVFFKIYGNENQRIIFQIDNHESCCEWYGIEYFDNPTELLDGKIKKIEYLDKTRTIEFMSTVSKESNPKQVSMFDNNISEFCDGVQLLKITYRIHCGFENLYFHVMLFNHHNGYYSHNYQIKWKHIPGLEDRNDKDRL